MSAMRRVETAVWWACPLDTYRVYGPLVVPAGLADDPQMLVTWERIHDEDLERYIEEHEADHHGIEAAGA